MQLFCIHLEKTGVGVEPEKVYEQYLILTFCFEGILEFQYRDFYVAIGVFRGVVRSGATMSRFTKEKRKRIASPFQV